MAMKEVRLKKRSALGEGHREQGTVLGRFELHPDVQEREFITAMRNPHLIEMVDPQEEKKAAKGQENKPRK